MQRLGFARTTRLAKVVNGRLVAPDFEFVVVIPGRGNAVFKQGIGNAGLPPGVGVRIGEIEVGAGFIPELDLRWAAVRVLDEQARRFHLPVSWVVVKQAGLDVRAQFHAVVEIILDEPGRVGKFLAVPVEHVALVVDGRVTGGKVE